MAKVYDNATDLITFARLQAQNTTSGSSYLGSDGLLKFAAEDEPRIEYGSDGSLKGLLIEEQRTNLVTHSEDFTDASWTKINTEALSLDAEGPDRRANSAVTLVDSNATGAGTVYIRDSVTVSTATTYTFSVLAKADQLTGILLYLGGFTTPAPDGYYFDLQNGVVDDPYLVGTGLSPSIEDYGNGWYRCSLTFTTDASDTNGTLQLYVADLSGTPTITVDLDGTSSILIYGAQLEEGSFATSYIPTSGGQKTRDPDIASIPVSAFGYNQTAGTLVVEVEPYVFSDGEYYLSLNDGTADERAEIIYSADVFATMVSSGVQASAINLGDASGAMKIASALKENDAAACLNGGPIGTDTSTLMPVGVTTLTIGDRAVSSNTKLNGHIKSIQYYPRRLTDAQLQELTS